MTGLGSVLSYGLPILGGLAGAALSPRASSAISSYGAANVPRATLGNTYGVSGGHQLPFSSPMSFGTSAPTQLSRGRYSGLAPLAGIALPAMGALAGYAANKFFSPSEATPPQPPQAAGGGGLMGAIASGLPVLSSLYDVGNSLWNMHNQARAPGMPPAIGAPPAMLPPSSPPPAVNSMHPDAIPVPPMRQFAPAPAYTLADLENASMRPRGTATSMPAVVPQNNSPVAMPTPSAPMPRQTPSWASRPHDPGAPPQVMRSNPTPITSSLLPPIPPPASTAPYSSGTWGGLSSNRGPLSPNLGYLSGIGGYFNANPNSGSRNSSEWADLGTRPSFGSTLGNVGKYGAALGTAGLGAYGLYKGAQYLKNKWNGNAPAEPAAIPANAPSLSAMSQANDQGMPSSMQMSQSPRQTSAPYSSTGANPYLTYASQGRRRSRGRYGV